jgi:hypothetical protein
LRAWLDDLGEHTVRVLDIDDGPEQLATLIVSNIQDAFHELKEFEVERTAAGLPQALQAAFDDDETDLERYEADALRQYSIGIQDSEVMNRETMDRSPAAAAAREALLDAEDAIGLNEYATALQLLERALLNKPLDPEVNFILAKYYLALGNKYELAGAAEKAKRAYKLFNSRKKYAKAALAALLQAKIHRKLNNIQDALTSVIDASNLLRGNAELLLEVARYQVLAGQRAQAVETLTKEVYIRRAGVATRTFSDPDFKPVWALMQEFLEAESQRIRVSAQQTLKGGQEVAQHLGLSERLVELDPGLSVIAVKKLARHSTEVQHQRIARGLTLLAGEGETPEDRLRAAELAIQAAQRQLDLVQINRLSKEALVHRAQAQKVEDRQLQRLITQEKQANQDEASAEQRLVEASSHRDMVQHTSILNPEQLRQAIECFYARSLRKAPLMPYPTIFSAAVGKIIRTDQGQIDRFEREQREKGFAQKVEIIRPPYDWWPNPGITERSAELYRVMDLTPEKLTLSVLAAYQDQPDNTAQPTAV